MPPPRVWSFSTTIREPRRIRGFLRVLRILEGSPWNSNSQIRFQVLLIKEKEYRPTNVSDEINAIFDDPEAMFTEDEAGEVFHGKDYHDPPMRGRTSFAPLREMGLAYIDLNGLIRISELGDYFLSDDYDIGRVFLRFLVKWQYPNPISTKFSEARGFNVKPFIITLHLIHRVNELWAEEGNDRVGLSNDEFNLFTSTLKNYENLEDQAGKLIEYRKAVRRLPGQEQDAFRTQYSRDLVSGVFETNNTAAIAKNTRDLVDYGDSARRLFRLSRYLHVRGQGRYIDFEPLRMPEITSMLDEFDGSADSFASKDDYISYMVDMRKPHLPWINAKALNVIAESIAEDIELTQRWIKDRGESFPETPITDTAGYSQLRLEAYIKDLRSYRMELLLQRKGLEAQDEAVIRECIDALREIQAAKKSVGGLSCPLALEKYATIALNVLDDAVGIKPNYPVGDDGEPLMTAGANKADIECFYEGFDSICEVTTTRGRDQYYHEGHPVVRHLRDFAARRDSLESSYLLFIAPVIHDDTADHFLYQVRTLHEGKRQNIVPLTIEQLIELLEACVDIRNAEKRVAHEDIKNFMDSVIAQKDSAESARAWLNTVPDLIAQWRNQCMA